MRWISSLSGSLSWTRAHPPPPVAARTLRDRAAAGARRVRLLLHRALLQAPHEQALTAGGQDVCLEGRQRHRACSGEGPISHRGAPGHTGSHRVTQGHTVSHRSTQGHTGAHMVTQEHTGSHRSTQEHTGSRMGTQGHTGAHRGTGHACPHAATTQLDRPAGGMCEFAVAVAEVG